MAEFGSGMERYNKPGDDPEAEGLDTGDRDQLIEDASASLEAVPIDLSSDLREKFQGILDSTETYFESDPALAAEILETMTGILEQFSDIIDKDDLDDKASELEPDIGQLEKMAGRLVGKGVH